MAAAQKKFQDTWPTEEDFNQHSEILKWRDLQKGIYKIHGYKEKQNNFGVSLILEIRDSQNLAKLGQGCTTRGGEGIEFRFNWRCG